MKSTAGCFHAFTKSDRAKITARRRSNFRRAAIRSTVENDEGVSAFQIASERSLVATTASAHKSTL